MYSHFVNKRIPEFWKSWNANFKKNANNVNGYTSDVDIADEFAVHFKKVFCRSDDDVSSRSEYLHKHAECITDNVQSGSVCIDKVTVELVDRCLRKLKIGKARGPDDLCAEHL